MFIHLFNYVRIIGIGMMAVEELHDMEAASVHIEVYNGPRESDQG